jgi:ankyrin repeat protein
MARDSDGRTPLHLASMNGRIACIKLLVKNCVDTVDVLDDRGETPSELALRYGLKEIAVLIGQLCRRPGTMFDSLLFKLKFL